MNDVTAIGMFYWQIFFFLTTMYAVCIHKSETAKLCFFVKTSYCVCTGDPHTLLSLLCLFFFSLLIPLSHRILHSLLLCVNKHDWIETFWHSVQESSQFVINYCFRFKFTLKCTLCCHGLKISLPGLNTFHSLHMASTHEIFSCVVTPKSIFSLVFKMII